MWVCTSRIVEAGGPTAIVLPASGTAVRETLRGGDMSWDKFLELATTVNR